MQASETESLYNLLSLPFEAVDGKGISLDDINFSNGSVSARAANADTIMLWVDKGEGVFDYENWTHKSTGWIKVGTSDGFADCYPDGLPVGTAFWYKAAKRAVAGTATVSGAVCPDDYVEMEIIRDQYNFVSFPYPTALKLNDANQVDWGDASTSARAAQADTIMLWVKKGNGQYDYENFTKKSAGWTCVATGNLFEDEYPDGVAVGTGFWYKPYNKAGASATFKVKFTSPLASK